MGTRFLTENQIRNRIKELENEASKGNLTIPTARELDNLRAELEMIINSRYRLHRPWLKING